MTRIAGTITAAAEALQAWLDSQPAPRVRPTIPVADPVPPDGPATDAAGTDPAATAPAVPVSPARPALPAETQAAAAAAPLRLPHTDWLYHRLTITGPTAELRHFAAAAAGAGVIPWQLDLDRTQEDLFLLLAAPPPPHQRNLSLAGARILAGQLSQAVAHRHALAVARVGLSRACPLDLHALLPVPTEVLRCGPDDPAASAWLWTHWGTTAPLRHVRTVAGFPEEAAAPAVPAALRVGFFAADWTPWRAFTALAARWPALRFAVRPVYERA